jgi:2-dehydropantoate 2-reductase
MTSREAMSPRTVLRWPVRPALSDPARPSMGQDMMKGRRTEIDYMNGLVFKKGKETGIATPANEALIAAVKKVERGEADASPDLLAGI